MLSKRFFSISIAVMSLTFLGVVLSRATIPAPGGVIYGCFNKSGGSVRLIDNAVTKCASNEIEVTWNQAGTPGPTGPQGPAGPSGAVGATGPQGPAAPGGTSHVYITRVATASTTNTPSTIATLTVPSAG